MVPGHVQGLSRVPPDHPEGSPGGRVYSRGLWRTRGNEGRTQAAERAIESFVPLFDVRQLEPMNVSRSFLERNCSGSGAGVSPAGPGLLPALVRPRARRPHDRRDARPTT